MIRVERFLGREVTLPEDRGYSLRQGLWAKPEGEEIAFGLSEPALVLAGGLNDLDWLAAEGQRVATGEEVIFAITAKILYLDAPISGSISFHYEMKQHLSKLVQDPYDAGWLFKIRPEEEVKQAMQQFSSAAKYLESLEDSEGFRNPDGIKGGVSGICKAVYSGIRSQNI